MRFLRMSVIASLIAIALSSIAPGIGTATSPICTAPPERPLNPVLPAGTCGWVNAPALLKDGGVFKMWYACGPGNLRLATSSDGQSWADQGTVMTNGGCGWKSFDVYAPTVVKVGAVYHMWLNGSDGSVPSIGHATSPDGINWSINCGDPIIRPAVDPFVRYDGCFTMWYAEQSIPEGSGRILKATSCDGVNWSAPTVVLIPTEPWEAGGLGGPTVVFGVDDVTGLPGWHLYYHAWGAGATASIGEANGPDGVTWTKCATNPVISPRGSGWESAYVLSPEVVQNVPKANSLDEHRIYYTGSDPSTNNGKGIGYVVAVNPTPVNHATWGSLKILYR